MVMDKEEWTKKKTKMDDHLDISLASDSEGTDPFVDLREAQLCLWDPEYGTSTVGVR